jgi:WD40 repeat protein
MLYIWDTDTDALLLTLEGHTAGVCSVAFSPDGTKIASASYNKTLNIWDTDTGVLLQTLEGHTNEVRLLVFSPDSKLLALVSHKAMWLWDYTKYATPQTLRDNSSKPVETETVIFSPDGKELISASLGMEMWRWDTITGLLLA